MKASFIKKNVYGRFLYHPTNELAESFCRLLGRKSLSDRHMSDLERIPLDFDIEIAKTQLTMVWTPQVEVINE